MTTIIACVIAVISTAAFFSLWFLMVYRELRAKMDTVNSAENQLAICRKNHMMARDSSDEPSARTILSRSLDIYHQSVWLYNQTLYKPWKRIPGFLMGFHQIKDEKSVNL